MSFKVLVITLEHAQQRRETISARLSDLGLSCEFVSGVDGTKLDLKTNPAYEPIKRRLFFGRDLTAGEFGCVLAHRNVYQYMVKNQVEQALVLEDDAILTDDLPTVIKTLCSMKDRWDLVRFLGREKNYRATRAIYPLNNTKSWLARTHGTPGGAYGYMITLQGARRLLEQMQKNWLPIDTLHGLTWITKLRTFSVIPSPVLPDDNVPSCIDTQDDHQRWEKKIRVYKWQRPIYPLTRGLWKLYLGICVKIVWWKYLWTDKSLKNASSFEK